MVAVSGSEDRLKTLREKVGNPGDDRLITVVGRLSELRQSGVTWKRRL